MGATGASGAGGAAGGAAGERAAHQRGPRAPVAGGAAAAVRDRAAHARQGQHRIPQQLHGAHRGLGDRGAPEAVPRMLAAVRRALARVCGERACDGHVHRALAQDAAVLPRGGLDRPRPERRRGRGVHVLYRRRDGRQAHGRGAGRAAREPAGRGADLYACVAGPRRARAARGPGAQHHAGVRRGPAHGRIHPAHRVLQPDVRPGGRARRGVLRTHVPAAGPQHVCARRAAGVAGADQRRVPRGLGADSAGGDRRLAATRGGEAAERDPRVCTEGGRLLPGPRAARRVCAHAPCAGAQRRARAGGRAERGAVPRRRGARVVHRHRVREPRRAGAARGHVCRPAARAAAGGAPGGAGHRRRVPQRGARVGPGVHAVRAQLPAGAAAAAGGGREQPAPGAVPRGVPARRTRAAAPRRELPVPGDGAAAAVPPAPGVDPQAHGGGERGPLLAAAGDRGGGRAVPHGPGGRRGRRGAAADAHDRRLARGQEGGDAGEHGPALAAAPPGARRQRVPAPGQLRVRVDRADRGALRQLLPAGQAEKGRGRRRGRGAQPPRAEPAAHPGGLPRVRGIRRAERAALLDHLAARHGRLRGRDGHVPVPRAAPRGAPGLVHPVYPLGAGPQPLARQARAGGARARGGQCHLPAARAHRRRLPRGARPAGRALRAAHRNELPGGGVGAPRGARLCGRPVARACAGAGHAAQGAAPAQREPGGRAARVPAGDRARGACALRVRAAGAGAERQRGVQLGAGQAEREAGRGVVQRRPPPRAHAARLHEAQDERDEHPGDGARVPHRCWAARRARGARPRDGAPRGVRGVPHLQGTWRGAAHC